MSQDTLKKILRYVGNFQELGWEDTPSAPSLKDARGRRPAEHKELVVRYLRAGKCMFVSPGRDRDVFNSSKSETRTLMTDGTYAWPGIVAYYVEHYDVELARDFEDHMALMNWTIHDSIDLRMLLLPGNVDDALNG